jgi:hypothetical protein
MATKGRGLDMARHFINVRRILLGLTLLLVSFTVLAQDELPPPDISTEDFARMRARLVCSAVFVQNIGMAQVLEPASNVWRYPFIGILPETLPEGQTLGITVESGRSVVTVNDSSGFFLCSAFNPFRTSSSPSSCLESEGLSKTLGMTDPKNSISVSSA